ncbi:MAG: hypothetical protein H3C50_03965 [Kiritimatiellae bacterium]|nr:hypothetical protein [Kiritimatiellia bacterium]MCO5061156.1 hypothetical protein [Kiritimatiellia bacterium]MCO5067782.1 hypothetical protein [Kiritimatiellia bacterium]
MKKTALAVCLLMGLALTSVRAESTLGLGLRGFRAVDSLPHQFQRSGLGGYVNWRSQWTDLVSGQLELALYEDGFAGTTEEALAPQAFLLLGRGLYAGAGVGVLFADGDFADSPFLTLRAGYQVALAEWISLDLNVSYEFGEWKGVNVFDPSVESDTVAIGAGVRILF